MRLRQFLKIVGLSSVSPWNTIVGGLRLKWEQTFLLRRVFPSGPDALIGLIVYDKDPYAINPVTITDEFTASEAPFVVTPRHGKPGHLLRVDLTARDLFWVVANSGDEFLGCIRVDDPNLKFFVKR